MKVIVAVLAVLLLLLQYRLWVGDGSLAEVWHLTQSIQAQREENAALEERNRSLEAEVADLKQGLEAVEERARSELGMVRRDEVFYQIIEGGPPRVFGPARHEEGAASEGFP
jgi:cell division protein FtsB